MFDIFSADKKDVYTLTKSSSDSASRLPAPHLRIVLEKRTNISLCFFHRFPQGAGTLLNVFTVRWPLPPLPPHRRSHACFRDLDINGNDYVDWEEFTSFCIELAIVTGKVWNEREQHRSDFVLVLSDLWTVAVCWRHLCL